MDTIASYEGYKITYDAIANRDTLYDFIQDYELTGEEVCKLFTYWHGAQLCTAEFMDNTLRVEYGLESDTPD